MVDCRSTGQAGALARTHGWQQAPAAGLWRCARTGGGTSRPGQQLLPRSVGRRLPLPGQRRAFWQGRRRMVKPETPAKKRYVMCDTWRYGLWDGNALVGRSRYEQNEVAARTRISLAATKT